VITNLLCMGSVSRQMLQRREVARTWRHRGAHGVKNRKCWRIIGMQASASAARQLMAGAFKQSGIDGVFRRWRKWACGGGVTGGMAGGHRS